MFLYLLLEGSMTIREGAVARAREDAANGSSHFIAGQARVDSSAQHGVYKQQ